MSLSHIPMEWRRLVKERADQLCEYCLTAELDSFLGFDIDHIISEKHGGPTILDNLAFACVFCNQAKGSDIGSIYWESNEYVRLFHPRRDQWSDHFQFVGRRIEALTPIGKVTARLLKFNGSTRIQEREILTSIGRFPSDAARKRMAAT